MVARRCRFWSVVITVGVIEVVTGDGESGGHGEWSLLWVDSVGLLVILEDRG